MSKKMEWKEDAEVSGIALDLVEKYDEMFEGLDLSKLRFIRIMERKAVNIVDVLGVGFPFNIDNNYVYYIMTNNLKWNLLTEEQKNLAVMDALYTIAPGGTDVTSINYGQKRKKDINDYSIILGAAGGRYDWKEVGVSGLPNILEKEDKKEEKGESEND